MNCGHIGPQTRFIICPCSLLLHICPTWTSNVLVHHWTLSGYTGMMPAATGIILVSYFQLAVSFHLKAFLVAIFLGSPVPQVNTRMQLAVLLADYRADQRPE
ncbi:unnamed protein product [Staurois parvus]|uniref:Uncharacterized protein n=1 Tax=Staurois parvus TaxID=386267 RepID=A0ABN9BDB1_9NEOB|nr:unnamed protein product [Staurois parvus]